MMWNLSQKWVGKAEGLIAEGFLEDKETQLHFALKNIGEMLHDCSDRYVVDSKLKKIFFTIPNEKARIPISVKMVRRSKNSLIFSLCISPILKRKIKNNLMMMLSYYCQIPQKWL